VARGLGAVLHHGLGHQIPAHLDHALAHPLHLRRVVTLRARGADEASSHDVAEVGDEAHPGGHVAQVGERTPSLLVPGLDLLGARVQALGLRAHVIELEEAGLQVRIDLLLGEHAVRGRVEGPGLGLRGDHRFGVFRRGGHVFGGGLQVVGLASASG